MEERKRSISDGPIPKRKSGGARKKEANQKKLNSIALDKKQLKLNFGQNLSELKSQLVSTDQNEEEFYDDDLKHHGFINTDIQISKLSSLLVPVTSNDSKLKKNVIVTETEVSFISTHGSESSVDLRTQEVTNKNIEIQEFIDEDTKIKKFTNNTNEPTTNEDLQELDLSSQLLSTSSLNFKALKHDSNLAEKLTFLLKHPIQPQYAELPFSPYKVYYRQLSDTDKTRVPRQWLSFNKEEEKVYCSVCMAFSYIKDSLFVQGMKTLTKHIYKQVQVHENSKVHNEAVYAYMQAKKSNDISALINVNQRNAFLVQVSERRLFLSRIIEGILYIGRQSIAYRSNKGEQAYSLDDRSINHGNFLELLITWSKFDPFLEKQLEYVIKKSKHHNLLTPGRGRGSLVTFISKTTINKIITLISNFIQLEIGKEAREAKFFSLLVDSSQDVSVTDQLAICIRYVVKCEIKERLIKFLPVDSSKAADLYTTIKNALEHVGLSLTNIVSQAYDGAANLSGIHRGLQALIKKDAPNSIHTHCFSHILNLTLTQAASSCPEAVNLFLLLDRLAVFFGQSYKRMAKWKRTVVENHVGSDKMLSLQKIGQTRWWSKDVALNHVFDPISTPNEEKNRFLTVIKALLTVANSNDFDSLIKLEAQSIANKLLKFETILTAFIFHSLFSLSSSASACLQSKRLNYTLVFSLLNNLKTKLVEGVNNFEPVFEKATQFAQYFQSILENIDGTENTTWSCELMKNRIRQKKKMPGELVTDERPKDEKKRFEVEVYKTVFNNAFGTLNDR